VRAKAAGRTRESGGGGQRDRHHPENLTRIFSQGFTTRKDGHGFGLHSGILAAKHLGGTLTVQSAGVGCGAAFTLELPCQPPPAETKKASSGTPFAPKA